MQITGMAWRWRGGQLKWREGRDNPATKLKIIPKVRYGRNPMMLKKMLLGKEEKKR